MKPTLLRPRAEQDLVDTASHYRTEGGASLAERFFEAALAALEPVQRNPRIGSPRLGHLCDIRGLRSWPINGFALRWFYFETDLCVDVVRTLGERQDILAILRRAKA